MNRAVRYWSRALLVPIVSMSLVVYPFPAFAATAFSLSAVQKLTGSSALLPAFALQPEDVTPIGARDSAWRIADDYPAERYDLDALIDALDYDSERAFEFMRESIRFDPYRGVLRGSEGTLGAQAGNAIDRSLLLKDILDAMGFDSRVVHGTLPDAAARRVLAASVGKPATGAIRPPSGAQLEIAQAAAKAYEWLVDAVADESIGKAVSGATIADVRDHAWVQVREGSDWVDMDTSFPDAEVGSSFTKPERYADEPRAEDQYSIDIKIVAESLKGGELTEDVVLEYQAGTLAAEQSTIFLHFKPYGSGQGRAIAEALGPGAQWVPVIRVDEESTTGKRIPGILPTPEQMTEAKKFFYGTETAVTAALYLDARVTHPDGTVTQERRVLFDRIPAGSRTDSEIDVDDLLDLPMHDGKPIAYQEVHQILVSNGGINPRTAWADAGFAAWLPDRLKELGDDEMTTEQSLWALGALQAVYPVISEEFTIPALNDLPGTRFFVGAPRVFIMTLALLQQDDDVISEQSIDLLLDDIQFVSVDGSATAIAQRKRWYGVLQAALETSSIASMALATGADRNTVMSAFNDVGGKAVVLKSVDDLGDSLIYPARLLGDLKEGRAVVHAAGIQQVVETWWVVSPDDGATKAMLAPSLGGSRYGSGGSRRIGGSPRNGTAYRIFPDGSSTPEPYDKPRPKSQPRKPPPKGCRGGNEYLTVLCNVSIFSITVAALAGFVVVMLIAFAVIMVQEYLRAHPE